MRKFKAFSLIELMVVIAIIAILAALAVPQYKQYALRSKVSATVPVIDGLVERMITYANANGYYPNAYQLGLSTTPGNHFVDNPQAINKYFTSVQMFDSSSPTICGQSGYMSAIISPSLVGASNSAFLQVGCVLYHINRTITKVCMFRGYNGTGQSYGTSLVSGWVSYFSNTNYGNNNMSTLYSNDVLASSCM